MRLNEAITKFIDSVGAAGRSATTLVAYRKDLEQLEAELGDIEVTKITTEMLSKFSAHLAAQGFTPKTISRKVNSVKSFCKYLHQTGVLLMDPSKPVAHPKLENKAPRVLSVDELAALRKAVAKNLRVAALVELMLQTGLRIGEISRLKIEHLHMQSNPAQLVVAEQGNTPLRVVELNNRAVEVINEFLPMRMPGAHDRGFLFNTKNGGGMIVRNIRSAVDKPMQKAGIKNATVNDLRNTFIVGQLTKGVSVMKVGQVVGHKRAGSTEKFQELLGRNKPGKGTKLQEI